jgi:hypothetical protein
MGNINSGQEYHTRQTHYFVAPITWTDGTISVGWLPAGAMIVGGGVHVETAFAASATNTVDVGFRNAGDGTTADPDAYATLLAVNAKGYKVLDELAAATNVRLPAGAEITATYNGGTPTDGDGYVVVEYVVY